MFETPDLMTWQASQRREVSSMYSSSHFSPTRSFNDELGVEGAKGREGVGKKIERHEVLREKETAEIVKLSAEEVKEADDRERAMSSEMRTRRYRSRSEGSLTRMNN
ncbi:aluminum-activated malate transporter 9 [Striga asiatica]|uniref:Aluminum-activated malate transporter 9 n=1 Tax=Striga asiatica TaxID=4170 RepID=A0A5A7RIP3_STRAF|nr:aluminum-activated malate transporter 9 [Striga asiatica]